MNKHGDFLWYELITPDAGAAEGFYGQVLDWSFEGSADYRHIAASEGQIGGILTLSPDMAQGGARPVWLGYVAVDDVDVVAAQIVEAGGLVRMPPQDMAGVGRIAMLADPQGVSFYVMRGSRDGTSNAFAADRPMIGHCAWNELSTSDPAAAQAFYFGAFGWAKDGEMDMGPLGQYEFLRHGAMIGAVMPLMPGQERSAWTFYFRVADIDGAAAAITANGGTLVHGPQEIPGGEFSVNAVDPQGAAFGLVGPREG